MNTFQDIIIFLISSIGSFFLVVVLLRFLMQLARADFYNPLSQAIVKITNPILMPLRRMIPGLFGIDLASIFLALAVQFIIGESIYFVLFQTIFNPALMLFWGVLGCLNVLIYIAFACILILVVSSFIAPFSQHPAIILARQLLDPVLKPLQRLIPPMGGLDLSVMALGILLVVIQKLLYAMAISSNLAPQLIIGY